MNIPTIPEAEIEKLLSQLPTTSFIRQFVEYCATQTISPKIFTMTIAFTILGSALDRGYVTRLAPGQPVRPNFWAFLIGPPGTGLKSTPAEIGRTMLADIDPRLVEITSLASQEGLIEALTIAPQRLIFCNDGGGLLAKIDSSNNMGQGEKIKTTLLQLFDCAPVGEPLAKKARMVRDPRVSILLPCNVDEIEAYVTRQDWGTGFMSRFVVAYGAPERPDIRRKVANAELLYIEAQKRLSELSKLKIAPCVSWSEQGEAHFIEWMQQYRNVPGQDERKEASIGGRAGAHAMKIAMILAADLVDTRQNWEMPDGILMLATQIMDGLYKCALGISQVCGTSKEDRIIRQLRSRLTQEWQLLGGISTQMGLFYNKALQAAETLVQAGEAVLQPGSADGLTRIRLLGAPLGANPLVAAREELELD